MKARQITLACFLCSVLFVSTACAFRVLEPGDTAPTGATPQTGQQQSTEGQPTSDQPAVAESGSAAAGGEKPASSGESTAGSTSAGESQGGPAQESKAFMPAFEQGSAPAGCQQIVLNSGMEEDAVWRFVGGRPARYSTDAARSGMRSIQAGLIEGQPRHSYSDARQWITIPSNAITATLRMWWQPRTEEQAARLIERCTRGNCPTGSLAEGPLPAAHDLQYVLAVRPDWSFEWLLRAKANAIEWQPLEFDLTRYAGRTIAVQFGVYNDAGGGLTSMSVDDVEVWVCEQ